MLIFAITGGAIFAATSLALITTLNADTAYGSDTFQGEWEITCRFDRNPKPPLNDVISFRPSVWESAGKNEAESAQGGVLHAAVNFKRAGYNCPVSEGARADIQGVVDWIDVPRRQLFLRECVLIPDRPWVPPESAPPAKAPRGKSREKK